MPPVSILLVSHGAALGGSPISCYNIIKEIDKEKFRPVFVSGEEGPILERMRALNVPCYVIDKKGFIGLESIYRFFKIIKKEKIRLIHLNTLTSYYKYPAIAAKISRIPLIWFVREDPESKRGKRLFPWINKLADAVVPVSYDTKNKMYPQGAPSKVQVIHNGIDLEKFKPVKSDFLRKKFNLSPDIKLIGTVTSLEERKGVEYLLKAIPFVKKQAADFRLIVIGEDRSRSKSYLDKINQIIEEEKISNEVILAGAMENIYEAMNSLDIFVLPTLWEGLARTILEAMACAKPVIATSAGGNPEQVKDGLNGCLVPPKDPRALAEAIINLLENDELRLQMGEAGRVKAIEEFSIKKNLEKIEKLYKSCLM